MEGKLSLTEFDKAIRVEIPHIDAEKVRLGVTPAKASNLVSLLGDETTAGTWKCLWNEYLDDTLRTKSTVVRLNSLLDTIYEALLDAYGDIAKNKWTDDDRLKLGRKTGTRDPRTTDFPKIEEDCHLRLTADGGGDISIASYTTEDGSRASKPEHADGVEIAFRVDAPIVDKVDGAPETGGIIRHWELKNANDNTTMYQSSKAKFIMSLGTEKIGHHFQCFARWFNTKHPEINSRWTGPFGKTIS